MPGRDVTFPFTAVAGNESAKRAIMCLLADDGLSGVLIKGPSGTAKSVLARSVTRIDDRKVVDLPPGAGDEDVFGGIDLEMAVKEGQARMRGGVLSKADGNILYVDNINLMEPRTLNSVMECVNTHKVRIEREGISAEYPLYTSVIATMDPAEREIAPEVADRFDVCVSMVPEQDPHARGDVTLIAMDYRRDPKAFCARFDESDEEIRARVARARELIPKIRITRRDIQDICIVCKKLNAVGHRGDIAASRLARDLAAIDGRDHITADDIHEAAVMTLLHRRMPKKTSGPANLSLDDDAASSQPVKDEEIMEVSNKEIAQLTKMSNEDVDVDELVAQAEAEAAQAQPEEPQTQSEDAEELDGELGGSDEGGGIPDVDVTTLILDEVRNDLSALDASAEIHLNKVVGQMPRGNDSDDRSGRASGFRIPQGTTTDPALGPTIRAAAPYQKSRRPNGLKVVIEPQDIRENIRIKQSTCSFLFALDVSGSLVNTGMLNEAIQAVRAMLEDGYVRRDRVGLLTFGHSLVNLAVPLTRDVEAVFDAMEKTVTGGTTPLGNALLTIQKYMSGYVRKNPHEHCYVIMITDGDPDTPVIPGYEPKHELLKIAETVKIPNTQWIIIDNGSNSRRVNYAARLAAALNGRYIRMGDILDEDRDRSNETMILGTNSFGKF